jgi:hypothetical protein
MEITAGKKLEKMLNDYGITGRGAEEILREATKMINDFGSDSEPIEWRHPASSYSKEFYSCVWMGVLRGVAESWVRKNAEANQLKLFC